MFRFFMKKMLRRKPHDLPVVNVPRNIKCVISAGTQTVPILTVSVVLILTRSGSLNLTKVRSFISILAHALFARTGVHY
jgi:hypothetical protein